MTSSSGRIRSRPPRRAVTGPVYTGRASAPPADPPALVEPDLPRTAKVRDREGLRTGFTTGACAAAAAKAATLLLVTGRAASTVDIWLPAGYRAEFPVARCAWSTWEESAGREGRRGSWEEGRGRERNWAGEVAEAVVVKDAGDDPDVTHGAELTATVGWASRPGLHLWGGVGVGVVTRPGLGLEVGGPAINATPRELLRIATSEVADPDRTGLDVVISVPDGERMARRTTNARLGILGGISILGTTGIVRPFSTAAWRASVLQAIDVLAAGGQPACVLSTGGRTERAAMGLLPDLDQVCFVEVGDFTGAAVERCVARGLPWLVFVGMAGKLAKLGAGVMMTHYTRSRVDTGYLAEVTRRAGGGDALAGEVAAANTGRHAYELWRAAGIAPAAGDTVCDDVAGNLAGWARECGGSLTVDVALVDFDTLAPVGWSTRAPARLPTAGADPAAFDRERHG